MLILLYVTAIIISIVLERQERRHSFELALEFAKIGKQAPPRKPKLTMIQSVLNVVVGAVISGLGIAFITINFLTSNILGDKIDVEMLQFGAVFLATGIALVIVGLKAVEMNKKYGKMVQQRKA